MQQRRSARAHRTASHPAVQRTAPLPTIGAAATTARWRDRLATGPSSPLAAAAILITAGLLAAVLAFGAFQAVTWLTAADRHGSARQAAAPESTRATIYTIAPGRPTPTPAAPPPVAIADEPGDAPDSPGPSDAGIARFVIPDLGVDAPVVVKGLDAHRVMEAPEQPHEVAWYHFTSFPGRPGNAVFSGHLDFPGTGPAVFWDLPAIDVGNVIEVVLTDGTTYQYQVVSKTVYREATAPVAQIVGPTPIESITLITCAGVFDRTIGRYEDRLVVRAERVA